MNSEATGTHRCRHRRQQRPLLQASTRASAFGFWCVALCVCVCICSRSGNNRHGMVVTGFSSGRATSWHAGSTAERAIGGFHGKTNRNVAGSPGSPLRSASGRDGGRDAPPAPHRNHLDAIRRDEKALKHRFFALRHGQSLANVAGVIASDPDVACQKYGLSEEGEKQAKKAGDGLVRDFLAARAADRCLRGIAVVASDLLRARETARFAADAIRSHNRRQETDERESESIPLYSGAVATDTRLRERGFGEWDGGSDAHYHDVWKDDARDPYHTIRGVESVWSVTDRATDCVLDWERRLGDEGGGGGDGDGYYWVVCVAHGDVLQILQTAFHADLDPSQHRSMEHLETATLRPLELA